LSFGWRRKIHCGNTGSTANWAKLGVRVVPATVWEILHAADIDPAPRRTGPTWRQFRHAQAAGIVAVDFLHVDTVLLKRLHVLVFIAHSTRRDAVFQATGTRILRTAIAGQPVDRAT
jgi:hypothetical protein